MAAHRWVGVDQGYSQLGVAIVDPGGTVLASARVREPHTDGHDRDVALARLRTLLRRLEPFRDAPVRLAGYCYQHSGVAEAFAEAGWAVEGTKALNDVVAVYGLSEMRGNAVVAGCGTYAQVVYVDARQSVRWPGDDVAPELPEWPLSGQAYARFLAGRGLAGGDGVAEVEARPWRWAELGPLLSGRLAEPAGRDYLDAAAAAIVGTRDVFWRHSGAADAPEVVVGGGAVGDPRLWAAVEERVRACGLRPQRVQGDQAVGLARFALAHPDADPWGVVGRIRPAWLG